MREIPLKFYSKIGIFKKKGGGKRGALKKKGGGVKGAPKVDYVGC